MVLGRVEVTSGRSWRIRGPGRLWRLMTVSSRNCPWPPPTSTRVGRVGVWGGREERWDVMMVGLKE